MCKPVIQNPGDVEERRLFQHFIRITSGQFSGNFESSFWSRSVLQACYVYHPLRHAAIALASLHQCFIAGQEKLYSQQRKHDNARFALRQYTKAIEGTRKSLKDKDHSIIITVMCCVLFFCFESLRGQLASALIHLQSGFKILRSSYLQIDGSSVASKSVIRTEILSVFSRFGFQANYFIDKTHLVNEAQIIFQLESLSSHRLKPITTLEEAQACLYSCLNGTMFANHAEVPLKDLNSIGANYHMTRCAQLILFGDRSADAVKGREKALTVLEEWSTSFKRFLRAQEGSMSSKEINGSMLLKLHHSVASLMLTAACGCSKEQIRHFKQILEWSKALITADHSIMTTVMPAFSPDVGIIAPLFFVATKCPDPILRAEAKEVLASGPRREGIWDADVAVKIIESLHIRA